MIEDAEQIICDLLNFGEAARGHAVDWERVADRADAFLKQMREQRDAQQKTAAP